MGGAFAVFKRAGPLFWHAGSMAVCQCLALIPYFHDREILGLLITTWRYGYRSSVYQFLMRQHVIASIPG
ncbi:hypothetical protein OH492_14100 [Vibrio chagasii]|nr:hypothetical protein [Vibrio chagasii]